MKIYMGIDPGFTGALALMVTEPSDHVTEVQVHDAPLLKVGTRTEFNIPAMATMLRRYSRPQDRGVDLHVALELVGGMPKQSAWATGRFLHGAGLWEGMLVAFQIPYTRVAPQRWMRAMLEGSIDGDGKDRSRHRALQLFPEMAGLLTRRRDDGRADALLLCEFLRRGMPRGLKVSA